MAKLFELDKEWHDWVATRPQVIQDMATKLPHNLLYRIKSTGQRVCIVSYNEGGTVRVVVSGKYNLVPFETSVFGIYPEDLEECELPLPGEPLGVMLTAKEDIEAEIARRRTFIMEQRGH